jgi:hypothetical protein
MSRKIGRIAGFVFLCLLIFNPVYGGRPLVVDDAGAVPEKHLEFELGVVHDLPRPGGREQKLPVMTLTYGATHGLEFGLGIQRVNSDLKGEPPLRGLEALHAAAKYNFLEESLWPALALAFDLKIPTANRRRGLTTGKWDQNLLFIATKHFSPVAVDLNVGYLIVDSPRGEKLKNRFFAGTALRYAVGDKYHVVGEIFGQSRATRRDKHEVNFQIGLQFRPDLPVVFDAGVGRSLLRSGTRFHGTLGLTWLYRLNL